MKYLIYPAIAVVVIGLVAFLYSCKEKKAAVPKKVTPTEVKNLEWVKDAVIYEVNIRQFSKEGTFNAFAKDLPRLKALGVDILWLMPVHPIGEKNRKKPLGSYYSVKDYKAVNPEFGNLEDFKNLVKKTHENGMKLIIDWVPNHSAWDHAFVKERPEYYLKDSLGKMISPFDWTDVVRFDYNNREMRNWMIETMQWWLHETDIDGFRCDVAHMIPVDFWDTCRVALDAVKPVFFLAEADQPFLHQKAFDMSYDWKFHHIMNDIAKRKKNANHIEKHFNYVDSVYPQGSILMQFTSNHDENSWSGTEFERMKGGAQTFAVLAATVPGMLMLYNGQEAAFKRRLKFFEKDSITWGDYAYTQFYTTLTDLKTRNEALWNGVAGGGFERIKLTDEKNVFAFVREKNNDKIAVILNLSDKVRTIALRSDRADGNYKEVFTGNSISLKKYQKMTLQPWEYLVLEKE